MLGGGWCSGGGSAEVYGLLIRGIWVMSGIGLDGYCRDGLGCRLNRRRVSCGGRDCGLRRRWSGADWRWLSRRNFFLRRP